MNLPKDTYEYLASVADDRTILNMLSTNKTFNDPVFFERIMRRKYPLLIKFKKDDETWKKFFLRMAYYISKIEEEYGVPYIPSDSYDPDTTYKNRNRVSFCKHDDCYGLYEKDFSIYNWLLFNAIRSNQLNIVKLILNKNPNLNLDSLATPLLSIASDKGYLDMVKLLAPYSTKRNIGLRSAAHSGHLDIVKFLIERGADTLNEALRSAADGKQLDVFKYLLEKGANDLNGSLIYFAKAKRKGRSEAVKFLIDNVDYNVEILKIALVAAKEAGNVDTVKILERNIFSE